MWLESELGSARRSALPCRLRILRCWQRHRPTACAALSSPTTRAAVTYAPDHLPHQCLPLASVSSSSIPKARCSGYFNRYLPEVEVDTFADLPEALDALQRSPAQALIINDASVQLTAASGQLPYGTPAITCWLPGEQDTVRRLGVVAYLVEAGLYKPAAGGSRQAGAAESEPCCSSTTKRTSCIFFARMLESDKIATLSCRSRPAHGP